MKYRSYVKELPFLPRMAITALTGLVLFACAYLAAYTAYYLLSRYVKASILAATGLVNIYTAFPALRFREKGQLGVTAKNTGLPTASVNKIFKTPTIPSKQAARPGAQATAGPAAQSNSHLAAGTPALNRAGGPSAPLAKPASFADIAKEFTDKINDGSAETALPLDELDDGEFFDDI